MSCHCSCSMQPDRYQHDGRRHQRLQREVGLGLHEMLRKTGQDDDQHERRPQHPRSHPPCEEPRNRGGEPDRDKPVLEVKRDRVDPSHRVERGRIERGDERRVRRARERCEELLVEPVKVVERLGLRDPEGPAVEGVEPTQARRPKERLQKEPEHCDPDGCDNCEVDWAFSSGRDRSPETSSDHDRSGAENHRRPADRRKAERDADHQLQNPARSHRREAREIGKACQLDKLDAPVDASDRPDDAHPHQEEPGVEDEQAQDRADRHSGRLSSATPCSTSSQTTWAPGSCDRSQP